MPRPGLAEVVTGRSIAERFQGCGLGETLRFGMRDWKVVGVFDAGSTGFNSEIWGDADQLMQAFRRPVYSSVIFKLRDSSEFEAFKQRIEGDPRLTLEARRETRYYADQSETMAKFLRILGITLTIIFSDRVSIDPSSIATLNLRPPELQKELFDCIFDPYDYAKAVTRSPIVITGRVRFYAPGEFIIPPVKISYSCPSCSNGTDKTVRFIETEPVLFKVSSIIPKDQSENRLIVATDPVSPDFRLPALHQQTLRYQWLAIICFGGFVLCAVWLLLLRRKATVERVRIKERKRDGQMAEQLRTLLQATPTVPHWSYLGQVGSLLREYMVALHGIDVKHTGGSGKQFMETIRAHVSGECFDSLSTIFTAIDNSVALESEHCRDIDQLQLEILKAVDLASQKSAAQG